jgi:hypothetical protein
MSKKLIAVASAAALALSALVVMPTAAVASTFAVAIDGAATNSVDRAGGTSATSLQINVPTNDVLRFVESDASSSVTRDGTVIEMVVTTAGSTDDITITTTGGVKVITDTVFDSGDATSATASASTDKAASNEATLYAFTTSTAAGTVVISAGGSSQTIYISGLSTFGYKMNFSASASAGVSGEFELKGTVVDAFGNNLTSALEEGDFKITILGGSTSSPEAAVDEDDFDYSSTSKTYTITGAVRDSVGSQAVYLALDDAVAADKVSALGSTVTNQFFTITAADLAAQVTALTAQVAALTAQLAESRPNATSVTKKRYNTLARKWNAANPGSRVALKK